MWTYNTELYHHGILGMKWGVRRYQNKDGSLTNVGAKRRRQDDSYHPTKKKETTDNSKQKPVKKKVSEMSDAELKKKIARMQLEKQTYELEKSISTLNPKKVSVGEKFAKSLLNDVVAPAAKSAGKAYLEKMLKDKLGLNEKDKDSVEELRKEVLKLNLNKQKIELDKYFEENKKQQKSNKKDDKKDDKKDEDDK